MGLKVVTPPATEVVSLEEAKLHLRVTHTDEDAYIGTLISAARSMAEQLTERSIGEQTWLLQLDAIPDEILLQYPPVIAVDSVQYRDTDGNMQTIDSADYTVDTGLEPSWILPGVDYEWPETDESANALQVMYRAGYSPTDCPPAIKQWILLKVGEMYENREASTDRAASPMSFVDSLLDRYRIWEV